MVQWQYSNYPVIQGDKPTFLSGCVEIEMTAPPQLPVIKMGPTAEPNIIPRPLNHAKWRIVSEASDDLKRFVRGKYWPRIETRLLAEHLRTLGKHQAAETYDMMSI
jgi:hypothetical protein